ncbi:MAG: SGNH/GDSL hydrolase family protein [Sphingobacteriales bacterium]|nr:MAG: SGNH/GDSL hydrolase family protein [Sphingobacteriales bacterium]
MKLLEILLAVTIISGCAKKQTVPVKQPVKPDTTINGQQITYLALGDSYTIGESVPAAQNFPNQLAARLNQLGYKAAAPEIIARTGWTTDNLIDGIKSRDVKGEFNVVTLLIGVNNQYRRYDINTYRPEFAALLKTAVQYAGGDRKHVFVVSIPDYSVTPFARGSDKEKIAREIDEYNAIAKEEAEKLIISYTDITTISRNAAFDPDLIAGDGLHPSGKMYGQWVELLLPKVSEQLKK